MTELQLSTAIVVPVHNGLPHVQRSLPSVVATCPRSPLIVVDDCSDAETQQWLRQFLLAECPRAPDLRRILLRNERQQLFTRTVNRGIRRAYYLRRATVPFPIDFVAIVNSDCYLHDHWLRALLLGMDDPQVGLVGYCDRADGQEPALRELREPDYINGHCFLMRMRMLEEIGVLCETDTDGVNSPDLASYLGQAHYGSDRMLSWRANRAGWKTLDCHCRLCDHVGGGSSPPHPGWLANFHLQPLWPPCDHLDNPAWIEEEPVSEPVASVAAMPTWGEWGTRKSRE
jgi:GT2 family glycosyltransferase